MTHPLVQHLDVALAALWDAAAAVPEAIEGEAIQRPRSGQQPATRRRSAASLAAEGRLRRAERDDQVLNIRQGIAQIGASPAPVRAELLDLARGNIVGTALTDAAWILASGLRHRPLLVYGASWVDLWGCHEIAAAQWLRLALPHAPTGAGLDAVAVLNAEDTRVRAVLGQDRPRMAVPGNPACPACRRRLLRSEIVQLRPTVVRVVTCLAGCVCRGENCRCGMTIKAAGVRHIWPLDQVWQQVDATQVPCAA